MQQPKADKHYYVGNVPPALLQHPTLSPTAKLIGIALLMHYNRTSDLCYPTQKVIAAELGLNERTIIRATSELCACGMIGRESRKAPRGNAKGRANLYRLTGLLDLCSQPMLAASEVTKPPIRGDKMSLREVTKTTPHASGNRAITVNSNLPISTASGAAWLADDTSKTTVTDPGTEVTFEEGEVTKCHLTNRRIAQTGPLAGLSPEEIRQRRLAPDGTSAFEICADADAWFAARHVVEECAGGEPFNPGDLGKLCDQCGTEAVWFHAQWFLRRIGALKSPPNKPTAFFVDAVRNDYPVDPTWPEAPAQAMEVAAAIRAVAELLAPAIPF